MNVIESVSVIYVLYILCLTMFNNSIKLMCKVNSLQDLLVWVQASLHCGEI
jgi:hypothetical protein